MNEYTTALLQIVSSKISEGELAKGVGLRNYARRQPPPPESYFCFETLAICDSDSINKHIEALEKLIAPAKDFIIQRVEEGDDVTLLWFPSDSADNFTILTPESMKILSSYRIAFLIKSGTESK